VGNAKNYWPILGNLAILANTKYWPIILTIGLFKSPLASATISVAYLSKLRRDSVGVDFQLVRKLTNYVCAKPPESHLSEFRSTYRRRQQYLYYGDCGY